MNEIIRNADALLIQNLQRYAELWCSLRGKTQGILCKKALGDNQWLQKVVAGERRLNLNKYKQLTDWIEADLVELIPVLEEGIASEVKEAERRVEQMKTQLAELKGFLKKPDHKAEESV